MVRGERRNVHPGGTLGVPALPHAPARVHTDASALPGGKAAALRRALPGRGVREPKPTRKRNRPGIQRPPSPPCLVAGNETENRKQKLRAAPAPCGPPPLLGPRAPGLRRRVPARPARLVPRASSLAPRATSPPRPRRAVDLAAGRADLGVAGGAASRAALCTPASWLEGRLSAGRTRAASGRRGPQLHPSRWAASAREL